MNAARKLSLRWMAAWLLTLGAATASAQTPHTQWSLPQGAKVRIGKGTVETIAYSPDSKTLAVAGSVGVWLYDARTGTEIALLRGRQGSVKSVAYSPEGQTIIGGSDDGTTRIWNTQTGAHLRTLTGHTDEVTSVAYSSDGQTIASGSDDGTIRIWNSQTGAHRRTLTGHLSRVKSVAYSPDGRTDHRQRQR